MWLLFRPAFSISFLEVQGGCSCALHSRIVNQGNIGSRRFFAWWSGQDQTWTFTSSGSKSQSWCRLTLNRPALVMRFYNVNPHSCVNSRWIRNVFCFEILWRISKLHRSSQFFEGLSFAKTGVHPATSWIWGEGLRGFRAKEQSPVQHGGFPFSHCFCSWDLL